MSVTNSKRIDYLDAVRAYALILGIIFHASLSFMPMYIGWAVMDISTSATIPVFVLLSHAFRMELFFLIAGFFSHMTFQQQGGASFVKSRLVKLALPLVIGWLILRPLLVSCWIMGTESMRGDVNIGAALLQGFASLKALPAGLLIGTHLWFLYYLLGLSFVVLTLRYLLSWHQPTYRALTTLGDKFVSWMCRAKLAILLIAFPTACCLWFMDGWAVDTPDKSLLPDIPVTLLYGGFFIFGWLLHRQANLIAFFARLTWGRFALCIIASLVAIKLSAYQIQLSHPHYTLIKTAFMLSYALLMWTLTALTIGICKRLFMRPKAVIRYIADSAYWLYLIHLPVVVWLQIAFAELPLHWSLKLLSICTLTFLLSIVLYDAFVRSTFIGAILNGKRKPRMLFRYRQIVEFKPSL